MSGTQLGIKLIDGGNASASFAVEWDEETRDAMGDLDEIGVIMSILQFLYITAIANLDKDDVDDLLNAALEAHAES